MSGECIYKIRSTSLTPPGEIQMSHTHGFISWGIGCERLIYSFFNRDEVMFCRPTPRVKAENVCVQFSPTSLLMQNMQRWRTPHNDCSVGRLPECWGIFVTSLRPILSGVYWCNLEFQSCCFVWTTLHVSSLCIQGRADKSFALQRGFQLQSALRRQAKGTFTITRRPHKNGISS